MASLEKAFGYQGNNMNLPVSDLETALPFYLNVLGFKVLSRSTAPHNAAVLGRDQVQIGLAENGGDSSQDGCAFHVLGLEALFAEFKANGLNKELSDSPVRTVETTSGRCSTSLRQMVFAIGSASDRVNEFIHATTLGRLIGGQAQIAQSRTTESTLECSSPD